MGFQRKGDNFYISFYSWKQERQKEIQDQLGNVKYAKELKIVEDPIKWEIPHNFKTKPKRRKTDSSLKAKARLTIEPPSIATASAIQHPAAFTFEATKSLESQQYIAKKTAHEDSTRNLARILNKVRTRFAREEKPASQTKYFCQNCRQELCRDCFVHACISHDVEWMGNKQFRCVSPFHLDDRS